MSVPTPIIEPKLHIYMEHPPQESTGVPKYPNKLLPAVFREIDFKPGTVNLDYGGGYGKAATEYLASIGVKNLVYDPYQQSKTHNKLVLQQIRKYHGVDSVTCINVLNWIKEPTVRLAIIRNCYRVLKPKCRAYFSVAWYGRGKMPRHSPGYFNVQHKVVFFEPYIREVFPFVYHHMHYLEARKIINKEFEVRPLLIDGYYLDSTLQEKECD